MENVLEVLHGNQQKFLDIATDFLKLEGKFAQPQIKNQFLNLFFGIRNRMLNHPFQFLPVRTGLSS